MTRRRNHRAIFTEARVRKARRDGTCPLCGKPVKTGQNVGLIAAGWAHLSPCIVARRLQLAQPATEEEA